MSGRLLTPSQLRAEVDDMRTQRRREAARAWERIAPAVRDDVNRRLIEALDRIDAGSIASLKGRVQMPRGKISRLIWAALQSAGVEMSTPYEFALFDLVREDLRAAGYQYTKEGDLLI